MDNRQPPSQDIFTKMIRLESDRLADASSYWLQTVQPFIQGRKLRQPELAIAEHAYSLVSKADPEAAAWNMTEEGRLHPAAVIDWTRPEYRRPEPISRDGLKPELLASLAASMMPTSEDPAANIQRAHDLLLAAESYISALPEAPATGRAMVTAMCVAFAWITFDEILAGNEMATKKPPSSLPFVPKVTKTHDKADPDTLLAISADGLDKAVLQFFSCRHHPLTEQQFRHDQKQENRIRQQQGLSVDTSQFNDWETTAQAALREWRDRKRISLHNLIQMRWSRFRDQWLKQHRPA